VEHIGGDQAKNPTLAALAEINRVRLFRRRHNPVVSLAYHGAVVVGATFRALAGRRTSRASLAALLLPSRRAVLIRTIAGEVR
jgi:hypothetical protein